MTDLSFSVLSTSPCNTASNLLRAPEPSKSAGEFVYNCGMYFTMLAFWYILRGFCQQIYTGEKAVDLGNNITHLSFQS